jgi:hypothetical protein
MCFPADECKDNKNNQKIKELGKVYYLQQARRALELYQKQ